MRWGLCATILAPPSDILDFAAYHLDHGAHRLFLYLDDPGCDAYPVLKAHPKIRATLCDDAWWGGKRPKKHQVRQSRNATHAYARAGDVDWLIHIDVDEFLVSETGIAEPLAGLPRDQRIARIRPMEQLSGPGHHFKAFIPNGPARNRIVEALYPTWGASVKGGFLSHLAGKVFVRTGLPDMRIQIHNVFQNGDMIEGPDTTPGLDLAHCHAKTWEDWLAAYRFRLDRGSYRADLAPNRPRDRGGITLHELFRQIESDAGEPGLRAFFDEVCADTPALRDRLSRHGLLRRVDLDLNDTRERHFPAHSG